MERVTFIISVIILVSAFAYAESCKDSPVKVEYKPDIENCKSLKRTCCEDGNWSDWGKECVVDPYRIRTGAFSGYKTLEDCERNRNRIEASYKEYSYRYKPGTYEDLDCVNNPENDGYVFYELSSCHSYCYSGGISFYAAECSGETLWRFNYDESECR